MLYFLNILFGFRSYFNNSMRNTQWRWVFSELRFIAPLPDRASGAAPVRHRSADRNFLNRWKPVGDSRPRDVRIAFRLKRAPASRLKKMWYAYLSSCAWIWVTWRPSRRAKRPTAVWCRRRAGSFWATRAPWPRARRPGSPARRLRSRASPGTWRPCRTAGPWRRSNRRPLRCRPANQQNSVTGRSVLFRVFFFFLPATGVGGNGVGKLVAPPPNLKKWWGQTESEQRWYYNIALDVTKYDLWNITV